MRKVAKTIEQQIEGLKKKVAELERKLTERPEKEGIKIEISMTIDSFSALEELEKRILFDQQRVAAYLW